jgi:NIPSNAP
MDLAVVELRRYTLVPGARDEMISVFERELMETQEATGMWVLGTFRDLDRPDQFVWLRGFPDMGSRHRSLTAFYSGPAWKQHGPSVRPTMVDTDDVLLLRPAAPGTGLRPMPLPAPGAAEPGGLVTARVYPVELAGRAPRGEVASFVTEPAENTYPALPVRADASVYVTLDRSANRGAYDDRAEIARLAPTARSPLRG